MTITKEFIKTKDCVLCGKRELSPLSKMIDDKVDVKCNCCGSSYTAIIKRK